MAPSFYTCGKARTRVCMREIRPRFSLFLGACLLSLLTCLIHPQLLSAETARIGSEFRLNANTASFQRKAKVSVQNDGSFVAVWESNLQDGSNGGIVLRRFSNRGMAVGSEIIVNQTTLGPQSEPDVTTTAGGDIVVVWVNGGFLATEIRGRVFSANGIPKSNEFVVSSSLGNHPVVAAAPNDGFLVLWDRQTDSGRICNIFAQPYDSSRQPLGMEFQVNAQTTDGLQRFPDTVGLPDGDYMVVWTSNALDNGSGSSFDVFGRRVSASGGALGTEFLVNTYTFSIQGPPKISSDASGNFVTVWSGSRDDDTDGAVSARRFSQDGSPLGDDFLVNTVIHRSQDDADIGVSSDGRFVIAWTSDEEYFAGDPDNNVHMQVFDKSGIRSGAVFQVNTYTPYSQGFPAVDMNAAGQFVVVWDSSYQDGSTVSVYAQRFTLDPICGDANGDLTVAATDALLILQAAVGISQCEACVCDNAAPAGVTATDALGSLLLATQAAPFHVSRACNEASHRLPRCLVAKRRKLAPKPCCLH